MDNRELIERIEEYNPDEDIENTSEPGHIAGSYGINLAEGIFNKLKYDRDKRWESMARFFSDESEILGENYFERIKGLVS